MRREYIEEAKQPYRDAIKLAKEFISKAEATIEDMEKGNCWYSRPRASAKRASMELSNALVRVRHPR